MTQHTELQDARMYIVQVVPYIRWADRSQQKKEQVTWLRILEFAALGVLCVTVKC